MQTLERLSVCSFGYKFKLLLYSQKPACGQSVLPIQLATLSG